MNRYRHRTKGVIVEAMKLDENNVDNIANWAQAQVVEEKDAITGDAMVESLNIKTPDGVRRCQPGQYVVMHNEHFFVATPARFEELYALEA